MIPDVFIALDKHAEALPDLTSFKYKDNGSHLTTSEQVLALCKFLKNKKQLRRLDVALDAADEAVVPLLELFPELSELEVLGFDILRTAWMPRDIETFDRAIPLKITALRVHVSVHFFVDLPGFLSEWFSLVSRCSFFPVCCAFAATCWTLGSDLAALA